MTLSKKILRWCLGGFAIFMALLMVGVAVIYYMLQQDPDEMAKKYFSSIQEKTGLTISFASVNVTFLPLPAIALSSVSVQGRNLDFTMPWLSVRPDFLQLLKGDFSPAEVNLLRPRLIAGLPVPLTDISGIRQWLAQSAATFATGEKEEALAADSQCLVNITQAHVEIADPAQEKLVVNNARGKFYLGGNGRIRGDAAFASILFSRAQKKYLSLENLNISADAQPEKFWQANNIISASATGAVAGLLKKFAFDLSFQSDKGLWECPVKLAGDFDFNNVATPFSLGGNIHGDPQKGEIMFTAFDWLLDRDNGQFNCRLELPPAREDFSLEGDFHAKRASLTQWLGFARNLAPGLQISLDNIINARLRFQLNRKSLVVTDIVAQCQGSKFTGSGGVSDFSKPVVALHLRTDKANLGLAIPESLGQSPVPPRFPYPPLTPMPGKPLQPGETGIGYDIRLFASRLAYGPLLIGSAFLRIYPGKMDKIGLEDVLLDARGNFYEGKVTGNCILGAHREMPINIVARATGVNCLKVGKALPALPLQQGRFNGNVNVFSKGKTLPAFLANLHGAVSVKGSNGGLKGIKDRFSTLEARSNLRRAELGKSSLGFDGKWQASGHAPDYSGSAQLDGKLQFSRSGMTFRGLAGSLKLKLLKEKGILRPGAEISAKGVVSFAGNRVEAQKATVEIPGLKLHGSAKIDLDKTAVNGNVSSTVPNLQHTVQNLGLKSAAVPQAMQRLKFNSDFSWQSGLLKLGNLSAEFAAFACAGKMDINLRNQKPRIDFALHSDLFQLKNLLGSGKKSNSSLNFAFMRDFDAHGSVKIKKIIAFDLAIANFSTPLKLEKGILNLGPATASFYGGSIKSSCLLNFNKGLSFQTITAAKAFDLGAIGRDRKMESVLKGKVDLDASFNAQINSMAELPKKLNGAWSFSARNGSWQARKNGQLSGKPTAFRVTSASGTILSGVARSDNFVLDSPDMNVRGGGWANLANDKIDCNFNVSMKGLPDFPLHLYGTIADSKTSIGAGKMVLNAIGEITTGFVDVLGGVVRGAWSIFK